MKINIVPGLLKQFIRRINVWWLQAFFFRNHVLSIIEMIYFPLSHGMG